MKSKTSQDLLADKVDLLREKLEDADPALIARRCGALYARESGAGGELRLSLWQKPVAIPFPTLRARSEDPCEELPPHHQAMLMYYLLTCDGTPPAGQWQSFSQLPNGRFYDQAFQGYSGNALAEAFGEDLDGFCTAAESLFGRREFQLGSAAYRFQALPYVPLLAVYWLGDEDFPSSCQILFDSAVSHHLPTDACAILGSYLTRQLIKQREQSHENRHQR